MINTTLLVSCTSVRPEVIMSKGKPWYLDVDYNERHIYLYKDGKKLCQEGGPNSGKGIWACVPAYSTQANRFLLKVYLHALV